MRHLAKVVSYLGLGLTLVPAAIVLVINDDHSYKLMATVGMVLWFVSAPFWINKKVNG